MKKRNRALALLLAAAFLFNGTGCKSNRKSNQKTEINSTIAEECIDEINKIKVTYQNDDCYPTKTYIERLNEQSEKEPECSYKYDNLDVAIDEIIKVIKDNSLNFSGTGYTTLYEVPEDCEHLHKLGMDYLLKTALTELFSTATNDVNEDFCTLSEYRILFSSDTSNSNILGNCNYTNKVITIFYKNIMDFSLMDAQRELFLSDKDFEELYQEALIYNFYRTIKHEIDHVRQSKCSHKNDNLKNSIIRYNGVYTSTIGESSAESAIYNLSIDSLNDSNKSYTYIEERADEALLLMIGVTNESIDGYYNAIFDSNFDELYKFFHIENIEDIAAFYRVLYAIDSYNSRTGLTRTTDKSKVNFKDYIGNDYLIDLYKLALKNMVLYTYNNPDFSIEENVNLFMILKNMIVVEAAKVNESYETVYGDSFIKNFDAIDDSYRKFLCDFYNVDYSIIYDLEQNNYIFEADLIAINNNNGIDIEKLQKASKLLKKFPVLKAVMTAYYVTPESYFEYSLQSSEEISKQKR